MGDCIRLEQIVGSKRRALFVAAVVIAASAISVVWVIDRSERGVVLTVDTDKDEYALGEPVQICIQLKNYGFRTVNLVYNTSLIMHYRIYDLDGLLVFSPVLLEQPAFTTIALGPGETRSSEFAWNQVNNTDEQVELPESFTVHAFSGNYFHAETAFSISN